MGDVDEEEQVQGSGVSSQLVGALRTAPPAGGRRCVCVPSPTHPIPRQDRRAHLPRGAHSIRNGHHDSSSVIAVLLQTPCLQIFTTPPQIRPFQECMLL